MNKYRISQFFVGRFSRLDIQIYSLIFSRLYLSRKIIDKNGPEPAPWCLSGGWQTINEGCITVLRIIIYHADLIGMIRCSCNEDNCNIGNRFQSQGRVLLGQVLDLVFPLLTYLQRKCTELV